MRAASASETRSLPRQGRVGAEVPLVLRFADGTQVETRFAVEPAGGK